MKSAKHPAKQTGFTLIELMVSMVIIAIIMTVAIPSYRGYIQRANRADATTALLRITAGQERFFIQNGTYSNDLANPPPVGLGVGQTERGFYNLAVARPNAGQYQAVATIAAGGAQADDQDCAVFIVNERGQRTAFTNGGAENTDDCWR